LSQATNKNTLIELLHGKGAHVDPVACVQDLTAEVAGRKIDGYPHSTWQILTHMNYWMEYELKRIRGEHPPYPIHAADTWPSDSAPASEDHWKQAVAQLAKLIDELAALADSKPNVLHRQVSATDSVHSQQSSSIQAVLWQTVGHNSYHVGQIALLRRALGQWPPVGGGDSW
jgi:uncharacterized damage-inducible protein DinB